MYFYKSEKLAPTLTTYNLTKAFHWEKNKKQTQ